MNVRIIKKNKKDDIQSAGVIDDKVSGQSQLQYEYRNNLTNEEHFKLDESFVDSYKNKKANFGFNGLGEMVFYRTYSRPLPNDPNRKESFCDTVKRVVEGCYEIQRRHSAKIHVPWDYKKAQASAQEMFERIWDFKFLPPGRGLWMMGTEFMWTRGSAALNNCFAGDTKYITRDGIKTLKETVGTTQKILATGGKWVDAKIKSFGEQELLKLTLHRGRHTKIIYATADHRWLVKSKSKALAVAFGAEDESGPSRYKIREASTTELKPNMRLAVNFGSGIKNNLRPSVVGIMHGICVGDGTTGSDDNSHGTYLYLCGKKDEQLLKYFAEFHITDAPERGSEGAKRVADLPRFFRSMPNLSEATTYLYGWLAGYFAADGRISQKGSVQISSKDRNNLEAVKSVCAILGIGTNEITYGYQTITRKGQTKKFIQYRITLFADHLRDEFFLIDEHKKRFQDIRKSGRKEIPQYCYWVVDSVEETGRREEVYCAQVPDYNTFTLDGNILTGNCGFVSTIDIENEPAEPFCFLMDMSMLGVGVGFDTKGAGKLHIRLPNDFDGLKSDNAGTYVIEDSREGWVQSLRILINAYTLYPERGLPKFDYSKIRKEDEPIKGFGGKAAGSGILKSLHNMFISHFNQVAGQCLSSVDIVDLMNYIGRCVVAGNVRRTAEIAFGEYDDEEYSSMKNCMKSLLPEDYSEFWAVTGKLYDEAAKTGKEVVASWEDFAGGKIPTERLMPAISVFNKLNSHRWASNNSIFAKVGMDYTNVAQQIQVNGEPGLIYLDNVRDYGRMIDGKKPGIDGRVAGSNPCVEQSLESYELCNLVETFPANHKDAADYMRTLKFAYLYAKTVTLLPTHNARTNQVTLRNRRIGLSQSGIIQAFAKFGRRAVLRDFCDAGYNEIRRWDNIYSEWLCVTQSIKVTSVKPSGTVSLLVGATPGIHNPEARHYWRRVRIAKNNPLVKILADAGYHIEPVISDPDRTVVVKFAVSDSRVKPVNETTIWEQMANAIDYQRYWADNQVSCTVKFKSTEVDQIKQVLEAYEDQIKGISFLPMSDHGYAQAPYEPCTEAEVLEYNSKIKPADYSSYILEAVGSTYCDNDSCEMPQK